MPRPPSGQPTIYSIAAQLGVSPATVSKAFRQGHDISADLRERVLAASAAAGFQPRRVARPVTAIAVVVQQLAGHPPDLSTYVAATLEGIAAYVRAHGLDLTLFPRDLDDLTRMDVVRELRKRRVDGVIAMRANRASTWLGKVVRAGIPCVCAMSGDGRANRHVVGVDHAAYGRIAGGHLAGLGHRRAAALLSPPDSDEAMQRLAGLRGALGAAAVPDELVFAPDTAMPVHAWASSVGRRLAGMARRPGAVFCMDHAQAVGVLHGLQSAGCAVPSGMSLVTCDEYPESAYVGPGLTTVGIPYGAVGSAAAAAVHARIDGRAGASAELLVPALAVRASTARPG